MLRPHLLVCLLLVCIPVSAGATKVCDVQDYNPATGLSPLNGQRVTISGVVTVPPGIFVAQYTSIFVTGLGEDRCGVNVFSFEQIPQLSLGDTVTVTGTVEEYISTSGYGATTEITFDTDQDIVIRAGEQTPEPEVMFTGYVGREENEGRLVRVTGNIVGPVQRDGFTVDDGTGAIAIDDRGGHFATDPIWQALSTGDEVTVTGVVSQYTATVPYLDGYSIWPRLPEPPYEDVVPKQCIPGGTPKAYLQVSRSIFCPDRGEMVTIAYNGPHAGRLRLRVYDVCGREAATLDDRISLCGRTEFEWDGRNELMEALPMGLYHITVTATDSETGAETQETVPIVIGRKLE